jgi:hypothetical protein
MDVACTAAGAWLGWQALSNTASNSHRPTVRTPVFTMVMLLFERRHCSPVNRFKRFCPRSRSFLFAQPAHTD